MQGADLGLIERGALAAEDDTITWVGPMDSMPPNVRCDAPYDCAGALITPGLIDCHTHLVYAGDRADEFAQRLAGATYEEIARAGGGINSTVRATRAATEGELFQQSAPRLESLLGALVARLRVEPESFQAMPLGQSGAGLHHGAHRVCE